jgi:site-specific DNA-methyltransferase (adenine-specific)
VTSFAAQIRNLQRWRGRNPSRKLAVRRRAVSLACGDCLELMRNLADASVDMVLCDLPYGMTGCEWDKRIPLDRLWEQYRRVIKPAGAIVLTAAQPFAAELAASASDLFRYEWVWDKHFCTGYANAHRTPMRRHENVLVFYQRLPTYNPQGLRPIEGKRRPCRHSPVYGRIRERRGYRQRFTGYPHSILDIPRGMNLAACEKPASLMGYLIATYTNPGEVVLDNCMGLGSTGVAAVRSGRRFIGMEIDARRFATARERILAEARKGQRE